MIQTNWFGRGFGLRVAITVACQMAFVLFGYDQGVFSGIIGNADWLDTFGYPDSALLGIIVSIYNLGAFSGCIVAFTFSERWGRRLSMWIAMCFIIVSQFSVRREDRPRTQSGGAEPKQQVGGALQACAFTIPHIMIARYITGIGTGIETSTVPMYQSELCEANKRGRLVSSEPLFVGLGIEIAYWFDYGMSFVKSPASVPWRLPIACQVLFAIVRDPTKRRRNHSSS